jgi:ribonuclease Z
MLKLCGIQIGGRSTSGFDTSIVLPEMGISLDCGTGTAQARSCETVLITHGHLDHFGGIVRHAYIRHMTNMSASVFVVPEFLEDAVHQQFSFWARVQNAQKADYKVVVARPGEKVPVGGKRFVRAFRTIHRIPSQGYVIGETRKRLKPEYVGLDGRALGRLRREGVVFEDEFEALMVAFTGDTVAKVFDQDLEALRAQVLITECTFIGADVTLAEAHKKGHVHIDEIAAREGRFQNEAIMLAHFSHRHTREEVKDAILRLPEGLRAKTTYLPF